MQILVFSLIILLVVIYIIYKVKSSFSKKQFLTFTIGISLIFAAVIFTSYSNENKIPNEFKARYLKDKNIEISKLSAIQSNFEIVSSNKAKYDFLYIIEKNGKQYVCEAKDVEIQKIEDEYLFKEYKETCRAK